MKPCSTCAFWGGSKYRDGDGDCRRNPKVWIGKEWAFPPHAPDEGCGEHRDKEDL